MKYSNDLKEWRVIIIAVLVVFVVGFGVSLCGNLISSISDPKTDSLPIALMLILMAGASLFISYWWLTNVMEIEISGGMLTLTFITGKKMTASLYEVTRIKEDSKGYLMRIGRKDYYVLGKFDTASGKFERIGFMHPAYFPNAKFVKGMF